MAQVMYQNEFTGGCVRIPPSKSVAHRHVLCAALSRGTCVLSHVDLSEDIKATVAAVNALGVQTRFDEETGVLTLDASALGRQNAVIDCGESGSTLRFLIPIAAALGASARFLGRGLWASTGSCCPPTEWSSAPRAACPWRSPAG